MRRAALAATALVFATGAKCRRDDLPAVTIVDASMVDAAGVDAAPSAAPSSHVEAPSKPRFRRFDPASTLLHHARNAGGLSVNGVKPESLTPEQRTKADEITRALSESDRPPEALATLRDDLADGLRKGRFDEAKLKKDREALAAGMAPVLGAEAAALNDLHALLSPNQRAYVTMIGRPNRGLQVSGHGTTDLCRSWTADLDDSTRKKIESALPVPAVLAQSSADRFDAVSRAFEADTFDARALDVLDPKKKAVLPLDAETPFLRKIAGLLDEPSRKAVADRFAKEDLTRFGD